MTLQGDLFPPPSDWVPPTTPPEVPSGVVLAVDTETRDGGLARDRGAGWATRDGEIVGVSVAWGKERRYLPINHPDTANLEPDVVFPWLGDAMRRAETVVFHNRSYDEGWLSTQGVQVPANAQDTQAMAVLCDENRREYNLDAVCAWLGLPGKDMTLLREAAAAHGIKNVRAELWRLPARYVGPYAERDAGATLEVRERLARRVEEENLGEALRLETDLVPMFLEMRRRGIRIDAGRARQAQAQARARRDEVVEEIRRRTGERRLEFDHLNSAARLEALFVAENLDFPRTPKTKVGSFSSEWMEDHPHWLPQMVVRARVWNDAAEKFIQQYMLDFRHLGRIHSEIHQLRDDDGGTRSYRISYSDPPLQQLPSKDPDIMMAIRGAMLPEEGQLWLSEDYSQQEPRLAVHFASLAGRPGAEEAVAYYAERGDAADFHTMVAELTGLERKYAKIINLGLMYGMGVKKLARSLGVSLEEAEQMIEQYHRRVPWVRALSDFCSNRVRQRGHVVLLDGARCRFDQWERARRGDSHEAPRPSREAALQAWPNEPIRRAFAHKAMNRLVQGSAARQTKLAMRECWRAGHVPLIQMHDELCFSTDRERDAAEIGEIMREVVRLRVPMRVDAQWGRNWGEASNERDVRSFEEWRAAA